METNEVNPYSLILEMFVSIDPLRGEWMQKPFIVNDQVMSTDAHFIAMVDKSLVGEYDRLDDDTKKKVLDAIPKSRNLDFSIGLNVLIPIMELCPKVKEDLSVECDACEGEGEVTVDFFHKRKRYPIEGDCPVCDGYGFIKDKNQTEKMVFDYSKKIYIGESVFQAGFIGKLVEAAKILSVDHISLVQQKNQLSPNIFKIGNVEILLMPMAGIERDNPDVIACIEITSPQTAA